MSTVRILLDEAPGQTLEILGDFEMSRTPSVGECIATADDTLVVTFVFYDIRPEAIVPSLVLTRSGKAHEANRLREIEAIYLRSAGDNAHTESAEARRDNQENEK
jgi:hypothetical protein